MIISQMGISAANKFTVIKLCNLQLKNTVQRGGYYKEILPLSGEMRQENTRLMKGGSSYTFILLISSRSSLYRVAAMGTPSSIPIMPIMPPPTVTAARTQMAGRPMEEPTTLG